MRFAALVFFFSVSLLAQPSTELHHHDGGQPDQIIRLGWDLNSMAVGFSSPFQKTILDSIYFYAADLNRGINFRYGIYLVGSDGPSQPLLAPFAVKVKRVGWNGIDVSSLELALPAKFFLSFEYNWQDNIGFGVESREPVSGRIYDQDCCGWFLRERFDPLLHVVVHDGFSQAVTDYPLPESIRLVNAPNPFNGRTRISFDLAEPMPVSLFIFSVQGKYIRTLLSGRLHAGEHTVLWDGHDADGRAMPSGIYIARLVSDRLVSRKLLLVK